MDRTVKVLTENEYPALPKWPGVFVSGKSVTPEQAKEIIFRTDTNVVYPSKYSISSNNAQFVNRCLKLFGWDAFSKLQSAGDSRGFELAEQWSQEMGMVSTNYVYNTFLSSCYIGGPVGWCNLDGRIYFDGHNYGKWPSVESIVQDWEKLCFAFPFLDLACTLFDQEAGYDGKPVCTIVVKNGTVQVFEPDLSKHGEASPDEADIDELIGEQFKKMRDDITHSYSYERAWPEEWIQEFGEISTKVMKRITR